MSKHHNKNDYGEILFFEDDDVHTTIQPAQFNVLVWSCRIPYQFQYPSISTGFGQVLLQITQYDNVDVKPSFMSHVVKPFPLFQEDALVNQSLRISDYLTSTKHTALGRPIYVIDNVFREDMLTQLRDHLYLYSHYYYDDSDDVDETDNVQWISGYRTSEFVKSDMWTVVNQILEQLTGHIGWYPYDVSCNLNRAWDHTRIHKDCYDKDEYTFLLYLNPEFKPGDLAGTVFYEHEDLNTIVTSVQNKFGRIALFQCEIKHAGRPPHAYLTNARYSFAVKVARSKADAVKREMMGVVQDIVDFGSNEDDKEELAEEWIEEYYKRKNSDPEALEEKFVELQDESFAGMARNLRDSLVTAGH